MTFEMLVLLICGATATALYVYGKAFCDEVLGAMFGDLSPADRDAALLALSGGRPPMAVVYYAAMTILGVCVLALRALYRQSRPKIALWMGGNMLLRAQQRGWLSGPDCEVLARHLHARMCGCLGAEHPEAVPHLTPAELQGLDRHCRPPPMCYAYWLVNDAVNETLRLEIFAHDPDCVEDHGFSKAVVLRGDADLKPWLAERFVVLLNPAGSLAWWDQLRVALKLPADALVLGWHDNDVAAATDAYGRVGDALDDQDDNPEICALTGPYLVATKAEMEARCADLAREMKRIDSEADD